MTVTLAFQSSQERKLARFDGFRSLHQIGEIEAGNVVTYDNIRIDLFNEISPSLKHLGLILERQNLRAHNV